MGFVSIKLTGTASTLNKLIRRHNTIVNKNFRQALRNGAKLLQADEKTGLPSESGNTKKGIKVRAGKGSRHKGIISYKVVLRGVVDKNQHLYFSFVELGSKRIKATHDYQRIAERNRTAVQAKIASEVVSTS